MQRFLPPPVLTILLDIAPETAVQRKAVDRDRYERDLALQQRVRESYRRQAAASRRWVALDGERAKDDVAADVFSAVPVTTRAAVSARTSRTPALLQHPRARVQRRARRAHIVHQHDRPAPRRRAGRRAWPRTRRGRSRAAAPPAGRSASAWLARAAGAATHRQAEVPREVGRLVEAALRAAATDAAAPAPTSRRRRACRRRARASAPRAAAPATGGRRTSARARSRAARRRSRRRRGRDRWRAATGGTGRTRRRAGRVPGRQRIAAAVAERRRERRIDRQQARQTGPRVG